MSQAASSSSPYRNSGLFSGYYLDDRIGDLDEWECDEEAEAAFEELTDLWESEGDLLPSYKEDELLGSWIDEILDVLGYDSLQETTLPGGDGYNDRLLFESKETRREASRRKQEGNVEAMYGLSSAILEAKQYDADFDRKFDEQRSYHDASHQIRYYLDRAGGEVDWGILTNGKKWRLYGTKDYATEIYYEVDLVGLLERGNLEEFKYFYTFFRPAAYRETAGTSFLDTVWNESETAAQELGEDLQDNVFTALRILGEGFVETNDLDIDPDDTEKLDELKEQSLVLLYRLMFVLYAESRGLMQPDDPEKEAEYDENFSLDQLRLEIHERISSGDSYDDYSGYSTTIWGQLQDLFSLVDAGNDSLGVPPYNGGLFDADDHEFLAENEVSDPYITEVIHRLGTTENDNGELVLADYADLDTRHLGTIYEGLLEHEFRIASEEYAAVTDDGGQVWKPATEVSVADAVESVEKGSLYVVNDDGERKATGAYYTPDYVVSYIVEETIDPLLDEIKAELEADGLEPSDQAYFGRFYTQLLKLKILDPAMGSAHFLTSATGYLTEQVMEIVREQELQGRNEQELRRTIAKECIYGVDINGMAVELGKLSMWLETLAADKPLAFLDHHIKTGNSLVGSDITEVLSEDNGDNGGQLTLTQSFARARQETLGHVMDLMQDLLAIDNNALSDIKSMEKLYDEIRDDPLYQRLFEIANVHTAEQFGLDVPDGVYEEMAGAINDVDEWVEIRERDWFASAQSMADDQSFFHWELEFPEVFFGEDGSKLDGAGFDSVIGNPPYVRMEQIKPLKPYLSSIYQVHDDRVDLYGYFIEKSLNLSSGEYGVIVSNKWMRSEYGEKIRQRLSEANLQTILDFGDLEVFEGVSTYPCILIASDTKKDESTLVAKFDNLNFSDLNSAVDDIGNSTPTDSFGSGKWSLATAEQASVMATIEDVSIDLCDTDSIANTDVEDGIGWGIKTGGNKAFIVDSEKRSELISKDPNSEDLLKPLLKGTDISRFEIESADRYLIYVKHDVDIEKYPAIKEHLSQFRSQIGETATDEEWFELQQPQAEYERYFKNPKICYPDISKECSFAMDNQGNYLANTCYFIPSDSYALLGVLNSTAMNWYYNFVTSEYRGGYQRSFTHAIKTMPIPTGVETKSEDIAEYAERATDLRTQHRKLNLDLLDHLGNYSDGPTLTEIGLTQPPRGAANSILQETTEEYPNLRIGTASVTRESESTVEIRLTARYKPDPDKKGKDAYTETDPEIALRITDLTEMEADLIEAFVPVAVDEASGFADFRETATKTNSLVDRLHKLTLPAVSDVETGLKSYMQTKERAEELEAKIEQTDELIDEIVYELYGLTDEEIEIVEEAVSS